MRLWMIVCFFALAPSALAADDFRITLQPGSDPNFEGNGVAAQNLTHEPGQAESWRLTTSKARVVGEIISHGYFDVSRPHQIRPEADGQFFYELYDRNVAETEGRAWVVNLSQSGSTVTIRLAFPVDNGQAVLNLTRDVTPPSFTLEAATNITWQGFYTQSRTDEHARANLIIRPAPGGESVQHPTPDAALIQRFPIVGLRPETDYAYHVTFEDWSRNANASTERHVRTVAKPLFDAANFTAREPPPDATMPRPVSVLAVNFTGPAPPSKEFVTIFVDKTAWTQGFTLTDSRVEVRLSEPLGPGRHSVGFELSTPEGRRAETHWSFQVAGGSPGPSAWLVTGLVWGAVLLLRRRVR